MCRRVAVDVYTHIKIAAFTPAVELYHSEFCADVPQRKVATNFSKKKCNSKYSVEVFDSAMHAQ